MKKKPSEPFEDEHSALYKAFAEVEGNTGDMHRKFYQMGHTEAEKTIYTDLMAVADAGEIEVMRVELNRYFNK